MLSSVQPDDDGIMWRGLKTVSHTRLFATMSVNLPQFRRTLDSALETETRGLIVHHQKTAEERQSRSDPLDGE